MKNIVNLGNVATYINGYAFKPSDWAEDGTPIIRIQDLTGNSYQMNRFKGIVDSKYDVNSGDVLISWSASLGVYVWNRGNAVLNQHIFKVVFDKEEVDKDFFVFQIDNLLKRAANQAHGATMRHLTKPVFDALPFYLPDIKTQRLISSKLNLIVHLIEDHHEQLKKLDELIRSQYAERTKCSKANLDNIRRILSSFFTWLEDESYILKNPVRRIHKIRVDRNVKETYSDEAMERMRDECHSLRDLAIIDLLASSGMRVGELVHLNREDIDFENRECIVFGKGSKERPVYFDARTKIHLKNYLDSRTDDNPALFVSLLKPYNRLQISGVEIRLRSLGRELGIPKVHPHKFRRTLATRAIDKGMPIEQVQRLLGHTQIDTTMQYAMINQKNVKVSHQKYIA